MLHVVNGVAALEEGVNLSFSMIFGDSEDDSDDELYARIREQGEKGFRIISDPENDIPAPLLSQLEEAFYKLQGSHDMPPTGITLMIYETPTH